MSAYEDDGPADPEGFGTKARQDEALALIVASPGITIPELATAMEVRPAYLYRLLPELAKRGMVGRVGRHWYEEKEAT